MPCTRVSCGAGPSCPAPASNVRCRMKAFLILLCLLPVAGLASPRKVPFFVPGLLPYTISLVVPESASVLAHELSVEGDSIQARIEVSSPGYLVEVSGPLADTLWSHDFGSGPSGSEGNTITVSYEPAAHLLLVHFQAYKWDHAHKLRFIGLDHQPPSVWEYSTAQQDILPLLSGREDFAAGHEYWIYPLRFVGSAVEFQCIPLNRPEAQAPHPFAQDQQWYRVTAWMDGKRKATPVKVDPVH